MIRSTWLFFFICTTSVLVLGSDTLFATEHPHEDPNTNPKLAEIFAWLTVAVVLMENAFAVIFNSRFFLIFFSRKGLRSLIMILGSSLVVWKFNLDIFADLFNAVVPDKPIDRGFFSGFLSALTLSGGSASLHTLMTKLSIRSDRTDVEEKPESGKAWIVVRAAGLLPNQSLMVELNEIATPEDADAKQTHHVVGMCRARQKPWPLIKDYFLSRSDRFPRNGGYEVKPDTTYKIWVAKFDGDQPNRPANWQLLNDSLFTFESRAILDFDIKESFFTSDPITPPKDPKTES
jgi:hypothetical protein